MSQLRERLNGLKKSGEMGVIAFIMSFLPDKKLCLECIKALEQGGCDVLELGMPFSDPLADGEMIEKFHHRCVEKGLSLKEGMEFAFEVRKTVSMPLVIFTYFNPVYNMGIPEFRQALEHTGAEAVIVPDLPLEELTRLTEYGLDVIPMIAPSSPQERIKEADKLNPAFIYCVSVRGTTGMQVLPEEEIKDYLLQVKSSTSSPLALGFGISSPEQVRVFKGYADAVVIGSLLASIIEEYEAKPELLPGEIERTIRNFKKAGLSF
ncbi:tryptophan synthase subunit alpha [Thermosyntropha sp.]|uniref:tryptophan synthase subunit alpha n=1 Tax=Thermosyntropha sp. TaxID=2740820 RepID=UPI0025CFB2FE|nr:tryptophan synthase subunit alpha [Thermosyntropha sp.]MBO8158766.1 tryptophan synthase subunit alpha [Thermosyntropha sp.]